MKREVAAGIAGFSVEYVRFQTGRNEYQAELRCKVPMLSLKGVRTEGRTAALCCLKGFVFSDLTRIAACQRFGFLNGNRRNTRWGVRK